MNSCTYVLKVSPVTFSRKRRRCRLPMQVKPFPVRQLIGAIVRLGLLLHVAGRLAVQMRRDCKSEELTRTCRVALLRRVPACSLHASTPNMNGSAVTSECSAQATQAWPCAASRKALGPPNRPMPWDPWPCLEKSPDSGTPKYSNRQRSRAALKFVTASTRCYIAATLPNF